LKVEACDALSAEEIHDVAANESADNANNDIGDGAHLFVLVHNHTCDPAGESPKDDPYYYIHFCLQMVKVFRNSAILYLLCPWLIRVIYNPAFPSCIIRLIQMEV
jgi:hypothetical protein